MHFATVIFDLDGTLVDSLPGIELSTRHAIQECLPNRVVPDMRELVGPPIATMLATLWPDLSDLEVSRLAAAFREHYNTQGCRLSKLYPGVAEVLAALAAAGVVMHLLTNKPVGPTLTILENSNIRSHFRDVMSPDSVEPPFIAKTDGARILRARHRLESLSTVMVGDGLDDLASANACGFVFAVAAYGYGSAATRCPATKFFRMTKFSDILRLVL